MIARRRRSEKSEERSVRSEHPYELPRERLCRRAVQVIEQIPAEDAVDRPVFLQKSTAEKVWKCRELPLANVTIEVGEHVLDENLAAELFAEEAHIAADDRAEIEQPRRFARRQQA